MHVETRRVERAVITYVAASREDLDAALAYVREHGLQIKDTYVLKDSPMHYGANSIIIAERTLEEE